MMVADRCCSRTKNAGRGQINDAYELGLSAHLAAGIVSDWVLIRLGYDCNSVSSFNGFR